MAKFKKGSEVVNAVRHDGNWPTVRDWMKELDPPFGFPFLSAPPIYGNGYADGTLNVRTLEGVVPAQVGDYIVKDSAGNYSVHKVDEFERDFEPVAA